MKNVDHGDKTTQINLLIISDAYSSKLMEGSHFE